MSKPPTYGACGVEGCTDCLPLFDADNNEIPTGAALIDAIEAAIAAAARQPVVEPILTPIFTTETGLDDEPGAEIDSVAIVCPNCLAMGVDECDFGAIGFNETGDAYDFDGTIVHTLNRFGNVEVVIGEQDRDRHTLAFVCRTDNCRTFLDIDYTNGYEIDWVG